MTSLQDLRRKIIQTAYHAGEGHIASSLSCLRLIQVLFDEVLDITPDNWTDPGRPVFVLSKGHGCLALYAVLHAHGFITQQDLDDLGKPMGLLGGHPTRDIPGCWLTTGSLGQGLPMAVGMARARQIRKEPGQIYVLCGDGEMNEGSSLEAVRLAAQLRFSNLTIIIDANGSHPDMPWPALFHPYNMGGTMILGESPVMAQELKRGGMLMPNYLVVHTPKGWGVERMQREPEAWHRRVPTPQEYREIMEELT